MAPQDNASIREAPLGRKLRGRFPVAGRRTPWSTMTRQSTATTTGPLVYRACRCGRFHVEVPCEEDKAREEKRAAFRAQQLEAKRKPREKPA